MPSGSGRQQQQHPDLRLFATAILLRRRPMSVQASTAPILVARSPSAALDEAYRKVTWRLIPFLMVLWILAWIDRVNIGFAKLQMLERPEVQRNGLRPRRRHLLPRLLLLRSAEQPAAGEDRRRARPSRASRSCWGICCVAMMFVTTPAHVLPPALPARRVRGRLLPRRDPVPHLLVPDRAPRQGLRHVHVGIRARRRASAARWPARS